MSQTFANPRTTNVRDALYEDVSNSLDALRSHFSGSSFPPNPVVGQECYRTDSEKYYKWDGTEWTERGNVTESRVQTIETTLDDCVRCEYIGDTTTITLPNSSST